LATFIWGITGEGTLKSVAFFVATTGWISSLLINISPFMRFDGYYVFADYLKIDNLQPRAFALAKWKLRHWIFGFKHKAPEQINKQKQTLIIVYAWSTWIYRFFLFLGIAFLVYYFAFKLLGIFLFVVEIVWFILLPIFKEIREWWRLRSNIFLSLQVVRSIFLLGALAFIIFYPWKSSQKTPAIYQSEKFIEIFPPINSQVHDIFIKEKEFVQKNQKLINLDSPALNSQIEIAQAELELIQIKINNALDLESNRSDLLRLKSERKKIETQINNLNKIKSSLEIKAPFEGEITTFNNIKKNQWLNEDTPILKLIDKRNYQVIAFVSEQDILTLDLTREIRFTPSSALHENMIAYISSISKSPISNFDMYPIVTSIFDGPIAASEAPSGEIQSEESFYKVTLDLEGESSAIENKMLGVVNIGIESKSYFNRFLDFSTATLIRELNF
jgi:putative peptide zinc metalloprotease protein